MNTTRPIPAIILEQLGGNRAMVMIGGTPIADIRTLQVNFKAKASNRSNVLRITLDGNDTYTVETGRYSKFQYKVINSVSGVYGDSLKRIVESETGLALSL